MYACFQAVLFFNAEVLLSAFHQSQLLDKGWKLLWNLQVVANRMQAHFV